MSKAEIVVGENNTIGMWDLDRDPPPSRTYGLILVDGQEVPIASLGLDQLRSLTHFALMQAPAWVARYMCDAYRSKKRRDRANGKGASR